MNLFNLDGKIAVVTGGAKGIGAATARMLERAGAHVAVLDLDGTAGLRVDITSESAVKDAFARVAARWGGVDILVNNAGRVRRKPAVELAVEEWQGVLDVNLTGTFVCSRTAHPHMKARGSGAIVNVASIMGLSGGLFPNASYQASKGGVVNLTRALALEWAADDIRVNAVAPTFVRTEMTAALFSNPDVLNTVMQHTPLGRLPEPDDVAAAILYLCSDAARCVTGIVLPVDSGFLAR
ncbi:MAG: SDR family oxidoreductase [Acidobacteria bacterium]|nr:MAG: SDR family oxidoreductase [Acidobacteriota bacterium]